MALSSEQARSVDLPARREIVRYWGVVVAWMVLISTLSGDAFSASNTHSYLDPILRYFFPGITAADFAEAHWAIRKTAHFVEFFVLGCLGYWACRRGRAPQWRIQWMLQAFALAALYSLADEAHQAFIPSRSPSLLDSGIDTLGATTSLLVIYLKHRLSTRGLLR